MTAPPHLCHDLDTVRESFLRSQMRPLVQTEVRRLTYNPLALASCVPFLPERTSLRSLLAKGQKSANGSDTAASYMAPRIRT